MTDRHLAHSIYQVIGADPTGVWESGPPQKFGCGVFYGSNSTKNFTTVQTVDCMCNHEPFSEHNLTKINTRSSFVILQNVLNRQVARCNEG